MLELGSESLGRRRKLHSRSWRRGCDMPCDCAWLRTRGSAFGQPIVAPGARRPVACYIAGNWQ